MLIYFLRYLRYDTSPFFKAYGTVTECLMLAPHGRSVDSQAASHVSKWRRLGDDAASIGSQREKKNEQRDPDPPPFRKDADKTMREARQIANACCVVSLKVSKTQQT